MKGQDLLNLISDADSTLIEESENVSDIDKKKGQRINWILPIAGVVIIGLLVGVIVMNKSEKKEPNRILENKKYENLSSIIFLEDEELEYHSANADDRIRYGLPAEVSDIRITQEDVGDFIGIVGGIKNNSGENIVGKNAYHYSQYPESQSIIVVDMGDSYSFFCSYGYTIEIPLGESLQDAFVKYRLPEKGVKIEIHNYGGELEKTITEKSVIDKLVGILVDCKNIGYIEQNRRFVQSWYETYGNDYVYLDEDSGSITYRDISLEELAPDNAGKSVGTETASENHLLPVEDLADELWHKDSFEITIEVEEGFRITFMYCPVTNTISAFNGVFDLTEEAIQAIESFR